MDETHHYSDSSQLEESNRTLTVDVANLASEKEELNNELKEMQQRKCDFTLLFLFFLVNEQHGKRTDFYRNDISLSPGKCVKKLSHIRMIYREKAVKVPWISSCESLNRRAEHPFLKTAL